MQFVAPIPFEEAIKKLGGKTAIRSGFTASEWGDLPVALRERAFFSSRVESARFLGRGQAALTNWLAGARETITRPDGTTTTALAMGSRQQFVAEMQRLALAEGMGPLRPGDKGTIADITSQRRLELIFDTQVRQAHDYGNWLQGQDPDVLNEFPAQRFVRVLDVTEPRQWHTQFEDEVRLKTDIGYWSRINQDFGVPWGPWGWGCGHDVDDVDRAEAEAAGLIPQGQQLEPAIEDLNKRLQASTKGLPDELVQKLRDEFGDQIQIDGDTMRWTGASQPLPAPPAPPTPSPSPVPSPAAPTSPALAPTTHPLLAPPIRNRPVSKAAVLSMTHKKLRKQVSRALELIDRAHDDGQLSAMPITKLPRGKKHCGDYARGGGGIRVRSTAECPVWTTAHECGHWLDNKGFGIAKHDLDMPSSWAPELEKWRKAVMGSGAVGKLIAWNPIGIKRLKHRHYLLQPHEIWARSYAQWVAIRAKDPEMLAHLRRIRDGKAMHLVDSQWTDDDFAPIAAAIDDLFTQLGWIP